MNCPECNSEKIWKDGFRYPRGIKVQRYLCRVCGYRFSEKSVKIDVITQGVELFHPSSYLAEQMLGCRQFPIKEHLNGSSLFSGENVGPHFLDPLPITTVGKELYSFRHYNSDCQICASEGTKNLTRANLEEKALRESSLETKGKIINFAWQLQINGKSEKTIKTYSKYIQRLANYADINDPEAVKAVISVHFKSRNTKRLVCCAYNSFAKIQGIQWEKPKYKPEHHQVFIPTEQELQIAINTGHKINMIFSELLYETGARVNEAERLEWTNIDQERNKITIKASKNGTSRTIKVSKNLIERLLSLPKNESKTVFPKRSVNARRVAFRYRMKNLAKLHDNPRFLEIHYHTFRHCKALREYHKTKDILHVKSVLGHRKIETTMTYVDLYKQIYGDDYRGEFITKIASNKKDRIILMNEGWTLVEKDGDDWYFRRPK